MRRAVPCSFSLKTLVQLNSSLPASKDSEVVLYRRNFQRLAFTSLILSYLAALFRSDVVYEAAEEMHWNAVTCAGNALDIAFLASEASQGKTLEFP